MGDVFFVPLSVVCYHNSELNWKMNNGGMNSLGMNSIGMNSVGINSVGMNNGGTNSVRTNSIGMNKTGTKQTKWKCLREHRWKVGKFFQRFRLDWKIFHRLRESNEINSRQWVARHIRQHSSFFFIVSCGSVWIASFCERNCHSSNGLMALNIRRTIFDFHWLWCCHMMPRDDLDNSWEQIVVWCTRLSFLR